jgi:hypothetical protein
MHTALRRFPMRLLKTQELTLERRLPQPECIGGVVIIYVLLFAVAALVAISATSSIVGTRRRRS